MESNTQDPVLEPAPADDEPQLDLYTIPNYSRWFSWDEIHETERASLSEFFDGSSFSRTPRIYKEYRDFIISKYREAPSRRLTFTEVRKSLVGDISFLRKVFLFLEHWGLINFSAPSANDWGSVESESEGRFKVRAEEGPPHGVRVVVNPSSLKPVPLPAGVGIHGECGSKSPPLASYSDVFRDLKKHKGRLLCAHCGAGCDSSGHYEHLKVKSVLCLKCFTSGSYGDNKSADDFKFLQSADNIVASGLNWTEEENLRLLESILKHGDDWDLVAQNIQTKSKLECISRLIEMPFGDLMLGSFHGKRAVDGANENTSCAKEVQLGSSEVSVTVSEENLSHEQINESKLNVNAENKGPPLKRKHTAALSDADDSLIKQVARISAKFGPCLANAAAEAAVTAISEEIPCAKNLFDLEKELLPDGNGYPVPSNEPESILETRDSEMKDMLPLSATEETLSEKDAMPLTLRIRGVIATALGTAGAHAKLLADQEVREMEHLVGTLIDTQLKKMQYKLKDIQDLEKIMEQGYDMIEELEESTIAERIDVLQKVFNAGISRWRDPVVKS